MTVLAAAGMTQVRSASSTSSAVRFGLAARGLLPAGGRMRKAVAIAARSSLPDVGRTGKRAGGGASAAEREGLERADVRQHDPSVLFADESVAFETTQDGVHLADAARRQVGNRVLRDAKRQHVTAGVLDAEAAHGFDQRRGDACLEVLGEKTRETLHEADPALGEDRHQRANLRRTRADRDLEEIVARQPAEPEVRVRIRREDVRSPPLDQRRVAEDLAGREEMDQYTAAVRRRDRETRDARKDDVQAARVTARPVDDVATAVVPDAQPRV